MAPGGEQQQQQELPPLQKVTIQGPTLASLISRCSSSPGDIDGLLFGRVSLMTPSSLSDDTTTISSASSSSSLIATVTAFLASSTTCSFFDSSGHRLDAPNVARLLQSTATNDPSSSTSTSTSTLIGWFSSRRRSPLRPSLRESLLSLSLSSISHFSFSIDNDPSSSTFSPAIFLLLSTPFPDHPHPQTLIHTHEYRAYQFHSSTKSFHPKPVDLINIGPAFRGHYSSFCPNSNLPLLPVDVPIKEGLHKRTGRDTDLKNVSKDQHHLDFYAHAFDVGTLTKLMGSQIGNHTSGLETLYESMLAKLGTLSRLVETSSAKVLEQENYNMRLRHKVAGVE